MDQLKFIEDHGSGVLSDEFYSYLVEESGKPAEWMFLAGFLFEAEKAGRLGGREAWRQGGWEAGRLGSWEAGKLGSEKAGRFPGRD